MWGTWTRLLSLSFLKKCLKKLVFLSFLSNVQEVIILYHFGTLLFCFLITAVTVKVPLNNSWAEKTVSVSLKLLNLMFKFGRKIICLSSDLPRIDVAPWSLVAQGDTCVSTGLGRCQQDPDPELDYLRIRMCSVLGSWPLQCGGWKLSWRDSVESITLRQKACQRKKWKLLQEL